MQQQDPIDRINKVYGKIAEDDIISVAELSELSDGILLLIHNTIPQYNSYHKE